MKRLYYFLVSLLFLFHASVYPKSVISDESIALQEVWESPKTTLKAKMRVFYRDLKQPWPWDNFVEALDSSWDITSRGKSASIRDRALLRIYQNKTAPYLLGIGSVFVGILGGGIVKDIWKKSQKPRGSAEAGKGWIAFYAAKDLDISDHAMLTDEGVRQAWRRAVLKHHPDKWKPGETQKEHPTVDRLGKAEMTLQDFIENATEGQLRVLKLLMTNWKRQKEESQEKK